MKYFCLSGRRLFFLSYSCACSSFYVFFCFSFAVFFVCPAFILFVYYFTHVDSMYLFLKVIVSISNVVACSSDIMVRTQALFIKFYVTWFNLPPPPYMSRVNVPVLCKHHRSFHPPRPDCCYSIIRAWPGTAEGQGYWPTVAVPSYPEQYG